MGVYHGFKDTSSVTTVSGQTASQELDHNEDKSKEKERESLQHELAFGCGRIIQINIWVWK